MKMRSIPALAVLCLAVLGTIALPGAAAGSPSQIRAKSPIVIGAAVALSGGFEVADIPTLNATKLAIAEVNAKGGVLGRQLKLVVSDTQSQPAQGAKAGLDVISKGAQIVIVSSDFDFGSPAALQAESKGVISFSAAGTSPKFGPDGIGPLSFTMASVGTVEGATDAEFAYKRLHLRRAFEFIDTSMDFTKEVAFGFEDRFPQLAGKSGIVKRATFLQTDPSIANQITQFKTARPKPQFIFISSIQPGVAKAIRQIRAAGITVPIVGTDDLDGTDWLPAVPNLSNVYFPAYISFLGDDSNPKVNAYVKRYKKKFGSSTLKAYGVTGYDIVTAYARAVRKAGTTDPKKVAKALEGFRNVPLLTGPTTFTSKLHDQLLRPMTVMGITKGKDHFVTKWKLAKAPPIK
jgi:branched-chain amino acid transport system substrate-binding protein